MIVIEEPYWFFDEFDPERFEWKLYKKQKRIENIIEIIHIAFTVIIYALTVITELELILFVKSSLLH